MFCFFNFNTPGLKIYFGEPSDKMSDTNIYTCTFGLEKLNNLNIIGVGQNV